LAFFAGLLLLAASSACGPAGTLLPRSTKAISSGNASQVKQLYSLDVVGQQWIPRMAFSPTGNLLAVAHRSVTGDASGGPIKLFNLTTKAVVAELELVGIVTSLVFTSDSRLLAAGGREGDFAGWVKVWDVKTRKLVLTLHDFADGVWSVAFSPNGASLATGYGNPWGAPGGLKIWEVTTGKLLAEIGSLKDNPYQLSTVIGLEFNPAGTLLAAQIANGVVQIWGMANQKIVSTLSGYTTCECSFGLSPDFSRLATSGFKDTAGNPEFQMWDVAAGKLLYVLEENHVGIDSVIFNSNGQVLAVHNFDGTMHLVEVSTGKTLAILDDPGSLSIAFSPDNELMATSGDVVRLWGIAP
jgi:WD40 repeat protein